MADSKITDLTDGGAILSGDEFVVARTGADNKIAGAQLLAKLYHNQLGSDASSLDTGASGIASGWTCLRVVAKLRTDAAVVLSSGTSRVNGDTGGNYDRFDIGWNGTAIAAGSSYGATSFALDCLGNSADANRFTLVDLMVIDYAGSAYKQFNVSQHQIGTGANSNVRMHTGTWTWKSTSAINQIAFFPPSGNFKTGSSLTVYGLP